MIVWLMLLLLRCGRGPRSCCVQAEENAPIDVYLTRDDIRENLGISSSRIDLVLNGTLALDMLATPESAGVLGIPSTVAVVPIVVLPCSENVSVNFTWISMDPSVLSNPVVSVPHSFVLPICSYRIFIIFPCATVSRRNRVVSKLIIDAFTAGRTYAPIELFLSKACAPNSTVFENVTQFRSELAANSSGGCFIDTDAPTKSPTRLTTITKKSAMNAGVIAAAVIVPTAVSVIVAVLLSAILVWYCRQRKSISFTIEMLSSQYSATNPIFDRVAALKQAGPHAKEFSSEKVTFVRELGEGAFGRVYQGMASSIIAGEDSSIVAVKQLKTNTVEVDDALVMEFFKEVIFMSKLDHPRIVKLLGVCTLTEPYCMIFEYMDFGDLNAYLRSAIGLGPDCDEAEDKGTCFLQLSDLLSILEQIAEGMEYLSNQSLVHRDLATRNCLVATGLVVKISDFGLSRDVNSTDYYRVHGRAVLPIRWMAPESIIYGKFTVATDVWSFGVVMWEVFTYGQQPYVGLTNEEVINFVTKQGTLESPSGCPEKVTKLMAQCWSQSPASRPKFSKVLTAIQHLTSTLKDVMYDSPDYPALALQVTLTDAD